MRQMILRSLRHSVYSCALLAIILGCRSEQGEPPPQTRERPLVITANYPLKYFSQRITEDGCDVVYPVPGGIAPEAWNPDEAATAKIRDADRILSDGPDWVRWLGEIDPLPEVVVDTTHIFGNSLLQRDATSATETNSESSAPIDRLTWLNPQLARHQAETCLDALSRLNPPETMRYQRAFDQLQQELQEMDGQLTRITKDYAGDPLLAAAPRYNYLARRCGLNLKSLDWPIDKVPDENQWSTLRKVLKGHPAKWMLWPSKPKPEVARRLKLMGIDTVVFDPCETPPPTGDFLETMRENYRRLEEVIRSFSATPPPSKPAALPSGMRKLDATPGDAKTPSAGGILPRPMAGGSDRPKPAR